MRNLFSADLVRLRRSPGLWAAAVVPCTALALAEKGCLRFIEERDESPGNYYVDLRGGTNHA